MSQVTLQVGGRPYTVSCADGEEAHVERLAAIVDGKLAAMGTSLAPGDAKNLLFAALILADEADEARRTAVSIPGAHSDAQTAQGEENIARGLEALADRLEAVAQTLETGGQNA